MVALSNDGSRLIDATENARYIRVWDWQNMKIVQRLLLNEKAPEENDGKPHREITLKFSLGQELALSPDGRMIAACAYTGDGKISRVWNLESSAIVADIPSHQGYAPALNQEMVFDMVCDSISFSPDWKHMAILSKSGLYHNNESEFNSYRAFVNSQNINFNGEKSGLWHKKSISSEEAMAERRAHMYAPVDITSIALFNTSTWKLERFFYRASNPSGNWPVTHSQNFNSRPLFDAESKTVSTVLFDQAKDGIGGLRKWVGNRIVRWDIASGAQLEDKEMPQLTEKSPYSSELQGLWWAPLPGSREVWWRRNSRASWGQTEQEVEQCKQDPPSPPAFVSDEKSNCAYEWLLAILNLDTGKTRYLAPVKKTKPIEGTQDFYEANISPEGAHIVLFHKTENTQNRLRASSSIEVRSMETQQIEGHYSDNVRLGMNPVFSSNSSFLALPVNSTSHSWVQSALIFELDKSSSK